MKIRLPQNENGFSILEALVTLTILTVIILILYELMIGSMKATMFVESRNDLEVFAQRTVNMIQAATIQSRIIHQENPVGIQYRDLLIASSLPYPIYPDSRLPIADPGDPGCPTCDPEEPPIPAILDPDEDDETFVGNEMMLVRALEPVPILFDHDNDEDTKEIPFLVDRYRIEFYYLSLNTARSFNGSGSYLDLIKVQGPDFADYFQLNTTFPGLSADQKKQVADGLSKLPAGLTEEQKARMEICGNKDCTDGPIEQAWDPTVPLSGVTEDPPRYAFYNIDNAGDMTGVELASLNIRSKSMLPEFSGGRVGGKMEYSVATNSDTPLASGRFGPLRILDPVPVFGIKDINFPAGFEIKIIGPTGARSVWNRIVLCSENIRLQATGKGREINSHESVVITSAREF